MSTKWEGVKNSQNVVNVAYEWPPALAKDVCGGGHLLYRWQGLILSTFTYINEAKSTDLLLGLKLSNFRGSFFDVIKTENPQKMLWLEKVQTIWIGIFTTNRACNNVIVCCISGFGYPNINKNCLKLAPALDGIVSFLKKNISGNANVITKAIRAIALVITYRKIAKSLWFY